MNNRITRVELFTIRIPLPHVVFLGDIRIAAREFAVAVVETADGLCGWGHTFTRGAPVAAVARQCFASLLLGVDASLTTGLFSKMLRAATGFGAEGLALRALSILDIALWDWKARRANLPLYRLLGGVTERVRVLVPCGYRRENDEAYNLKRELETYRAAGITAVKTMFMPGELTANAQTVVEARKVMGPDAILGNDFYANGSDAPQVRKALDAVADARLDFVEDPFALTHRQAFASFRQQWPGTLVTGETVNTLPVARELCQSGWINAARFDATVCGGVSAWLQMRSLAAAHALPVWPHCFPEVHAQLAAATGEPFVESPLAAYETVHFASVLKTPLPIVGGYYELPSRPGLGLELDIEKIRALQVRES